MTNLHNMIGGPGAVFNNMVSFVISHVNDEKSCAVCTMNW